MGLRCCSRRRSIMLLADDYCLIYTVCGEKQRVTQKNTLSDSIHGGSLMDRMQGKSDSELLREYAEAPLRTAAERAARWATFVLGAGSFGLRREAERHAALDSAHGGLMRSVFPLPSGADPKRRRRCALSILRSSATAEDGAAQSKAAGEQLRQGEMGSQ